MSNESHIEVEFMPGRRARVPAEALTGPQSYVICRLVRQSNGLLAPVPIEFGPQVRMTRAEHDRLGLPMSYMTLRKLILSGFVLGNVVTPDTVTVDLRSLVAHLEATRVSWGKPKFWTPERVRRFQQADGAIRDMGE